MVVLPYDISLSNCDNSYFKSQSPIITGENRTGSIPYWSGSSRPVTGPFKLVMFVVNPRQR